MPTDVVISQLLDRSHQLDEIYVKDREEHETALTVRIQQEQRLKSDHKYPRDDGKSTGNKSNQLDNKRFKMKRPLPDLGYEKSHIEHDTELTERDQHQEDDEKLSEKKSKRLDNKQFKLKRPLPKLEDSDNQVEGNSGKNL
uniref:SJCHGC08315 protein n=1 Tax=Schistosoma japonicum TaxID=6182 RepID=Q5DBQ0_SCHJA|nr:SJCHGC08315 protein [Schistosoma japonicum]